MGFERRNATPGAAPRRPPLPERDHLLDDRPYLLGVRLGGLDPAMLDQRARQVGIERLPMGRVAPKLPACPLAPHRSSLSRRGGSGREPGAVSLTSSIDFLPKYCQRR